VSGAEDMRKARNQILDMLVEIGNLREDRDKLIEGGSMTDYEAIAQRLASVNCPTATQQAVVDGAAAALQALSIFKTVAQGEVKKLRARLSLYNSGGFADADALAAKFIDLTAELDRLREERDALAAKPKELKP